MKLGEMGLQVTPTPDGLWARADERLRAVDIATLPFPGFATDFMPLAVALLATADGTAIVTENVFDNRLGFVAELNRMGADVRNEGRHAVDPRRPPVVGRARARARRARGRRARARRARGRRRDRRCSTRSTSTAATPTSRARSAPSAPTSNASTTGADRSVPNAARPSVGEPRRRVMAGQSISDRASAATSQSDRGQSGWLEQCKPSAT